jgi:hypothetical protein
MQISISEGLTAKIKAVHFLYHFPILIGFEINCQKSKILQIQVVCRLSGCGGIITTGCANQGIFQPGKAQ